MNKGLSRIVIMALTLTLSPAFAKKDSKHEGHDEKEAHHHAATLEVAKDGVQVLKVKGMVCELCAQGVKKKLKAQSEVKDVVVKIKDHKVEITYKDPKVTIPQKRLSELLLDAGYELEN